MKRLLTMAMLALSLAACQSTTGNDVSPAAATAEATPESHMQSGNLAFAQAACGGCHAVEGGALSPNPASPSFADIANRKELSDVSLATWLRDAHNYPEVMDFDLDDAQVDALAAYILTLRDPDYRAPIS
ncbi:MAG: c-type cytochrome [Novosphingobium sp.]|nr:c-type cytochrome [Novosphingobium sp.]